MVSKKEVIGQVKKFNQDLDRYVSSIDSSLLIDKTISTSESTNSEYLALVSSALLDVRKELILMRKNLTIDVESMVKSSLGQFENSIAKKIFSSQSNMFLENKRVFLESQESIHDNMSRLQKELSLYKSSFGMLSEELKEIKEQNQKMKLIYHETISNLKKEIQNFSQDLVSNKTLSSNSENFGMGLSQGQSDDSYNSQLDLSAEYRSLTRDYSDESLVSTNTTKKRSTPNNASKILEIDSRIKKLEQVRSN